MTFSEQIASRTLWAECRNEPLEGQFAVAHSFWNRLALGTWGHTLAAVCLAPVQYSCWLANDPQRSVMAALRDDDPVLSRCRSILMYAAIQPPEERRPEYDCTHYHGDYMQTFPKWALQGTKLGHIGRHIFYNKVP